MEIPEWTLEDRLRKAREHAGLKQDELAPKVGISKNSLSRYELGQRHPKDAIIAAWASATGVSEEWLKTGYVPPKPITELTITWRPDGVIVE